LLPFAARLYQRGILCIPLNKDGRHIKLSAMGLPSPHLTTFQKDLKETVFVGTLVGLAQSRPSPEAVQSWFAAHDGNIGIAGGAGDVVILDFDDIKLFEAFKRKWPALVSSTPVERTPAGFHVYLRCTVPYATSTLYAGSRKAGHLKALGGYAVCGPSVLKDGSRYTWLAGQSPAEMELQRIPSIEHLGFRQRSPLRRLYDRFLARDRFSPA
jgi:hypothetical protein